jgi:hypothetical protein
MLQILSMGIKRFLKKLSVQLCSGPMLSATLCRTQGFDRPNPFPPIKNLGEPMLKRLLACLTALLLPATLLAEPVSISERGPVDIRRTTFVVRDIEKSLPLYRDALGLKVIYDQLIGGGTDAAGNFIELNQLLGAPASMPAN